MTPKRVLHVLPHSGGGGEVYVSMLDSVSGFTHERFYLSTGRTPSSAAASLPRRLPGLLRRIRAADLLHVHGDAAAIIVGPLLGFRPSVITTHGLHLLRRSTRTARAGTQLCLRGAIALSDSVIATSQSELSELLPVIRTSDQRKLHVILNGVEPPLPLSEAERRQIRAALDIDPGTVLGLFAGELESRKEPLLAAAAAARVRNAGVPFVLAFAGRGPLGATVGVRGGSAIRLLGFRDDLDRLLDAADLFVQTSSREGMSLALLEAMSHGLAIVAADSPGNAEAVSEAGLQFRVGDESALVDAITRICSDQEFRRELGEMATRRSVEAFGAQRFRAQVSAAYGNVLKEPAGGCGEPLV